MMTVTVMITLMMMTLMMMTVTVMMTLITIIIKIKIIDQSKLLRFLQSHLFLLTFGILSLNNSS